MGASLPFRRRLELRHDGRAVEAELEDHIHHVAVRVVHDGRTVTEVEGRALRLPWTVCPAAAPALQELVGTAIGTMPRVLDPRQHCTHLLDTARAAIRFAGDPEPRRRLEVEVSAWDTREPQVLLVCDPEAGAGPEIDQFVRRATWMAGARGIDLDDYDTPDQAGLPVGSCYASQPDRIAVAFRNRGSSLPQLD